jgi:hypothetical protein
MDRERSAFLQSREGKSSCAKPNSLPETRTWAIKPPLYSRRHSGRFIMLSAARIVRPVQRATTKRHFGWLQKNMGYEVSTHTWTPATLFKITESKINIHDPIWNWNKSPARINSSTLPLLCFLIDSTHYRKMLEFGKPRTKLGHSTKEVLVDSLRICSFLEP